MKLDISMCNWSMKSQSIPPRNCCRKDLNMYMIIPLPDVCRSLGGIILNALWIQSDRARVLSVNELLMSYLDMDLKYCFPPSLSLCFLFLAMHSSFRVKYSQFGLMWLNICHVHLQSRYGHCTPSLLPGYCPNHLLFPSVSPMKKCIHTFTWTFLPRTMRLNPLSSEIFLRDLNANEIQVCLSWILSLVGVWLAVPFL